jgi:hypothetical protein
MPGAVRHQIQLTKSQTTHCFSAIPDYIAAQRVGFARSFWPGFLFGRKSSFERLRPFEFQVLSVIRKSGSRFSREIVLQPLSDAKETT